MHRASPIQAAILAGDRQTGVSLMRMAEGLDTGPVYAVEQTAIGAHESAGDLHDRLAELGADLLNRCLDPILDDALTPVPQRETEVTYAARISKADACIDWSRSAVDIDRQIRAYDPWPVAETLLDGERMRCWRSVAMDNEPPADKPCRPGLIEAVTGEGIDVRTSQGILRLIELQMPGRRRMDAGDFARGHDIAGKMLGAPAS